MERSALINKVKTRIDEVCASGDVIVEVDVENTKPYDSIIDELLDESALEVLLKAPFYRLPITKDTNMQATKDSSDDYIGIVNIPTGFLRLVSFKMQGWLQPVTSFALPGDEVAIKQSNKYIRGGIAKPVAVLFRDGTNTYAQYYSVNSVDKHNVSEFLYIKKHSATELADASAELVDAMCWLCAAKTLGVLGENTLANQCFENAKGLML